MEACGCYCAAGPPPHPTATSSGPPASVASAWEPLSCVRIHLACHCHLYTWMGYLS